MLKRDEERTVDMQKWSCYNPNGILYLGVAMQL